MTIELIFHGNFEKNFLDRISEIITNEVKCKVKLTESPNSLINYYDNERRQYNGNMLLKLMESYPKALNTKQIGLFRVDLFIPILTYIFGQAILNGESGIVSIYRLRNELYGMNNDEDLLISRFGKVILHEIGHTLGLLHCYNPTCVMRSSTYVEDIDQKSPSYCQKCKELSGLK